MLIDIAPIPALLDVPLSQVPVQAYYLIAGLFSIVITIMAFGAYVNWSRRQCFGAKKVLVRNGIPLIHPERIVSEDRIAASESEADCLVELHWGQEAVGRYGRSGPTALRPYCDVKILRRGAWFHPPAARVWGADPPSRIVRYRSDVRLTVSGAHPAAEVERYLCSIFSRKQKMTYLWPEDAASPKASQGGKQV